MLVLASTTDLVQVVSGQAASLDVHASWADALAGAITPGRGNVVIATAATTTVVAAPAASTQRNVKALHIRNKHATQACDVTVQHTDGTTIARLYRTTLNPADMLEYTDTNGFVVGTTGQIPAAPYVLKTGDTMSGSLTMNVNYPQLTLNNTDPSNPSAAVYYTRNGLARWWLGPTGNETGGNVGSDYGIYAYDDTGAGLGTPWVTIYRHNGNILLGGNVSVGSP